MRVSASVGAFVTGAGAVGDSDGGLGTALRSEYHTIPQRNAPHASSIIDQTSDNTLYQYYTFDSFVSVS